MREVPAQRRFVPRSLSISLGIQKAGFYQPKLSGALIFASFTVANVIASGGYPAPARPLFAAESGLTLPPG